MISFRIGHPEYIYQLDGTGAAIYGGRWNSIGQRMLYTAANSSLAILELLTHINVPVAQLTYKLIQLEFKNNHVLKLSDQTDSLPLNWVNHPQGLNLTRKIGDQWLKEGSSPILKVPSVHTPFEYNYLMNPLHPDFRVNIKEKSWYLLDNRLIKVVKK